MRHSLATRVVVAVIALATIGGHAFAGPRAVSKVLGYVTAYSHDGNGSIRAPYRNTDVGYQVRLPRGTWVYCRTSCSETLRVNTSMFGPTSTTPTPSASARCSRNAASPAACIGSLASKLSAPHPATSAGMTELRAQQLGRVANDERVGAPLLADSACRSMPADERELVAQGEHLGADRVHQRLVTAHR